VSAPANRTTAAGRVLRLAYHAARNLPDRVLHRGRHRSALGRIARSARPRKILVVCYGNVCRSPYLKAVLQRQLTDVVVSSAGFFGSDRTVPQLALASGAKRGLDLSSHRSRPLTQSTVKGADLIIVMDSAQAQQLAKMFRVDARRIVIAGDLDPRFEKGRAITDPWKQPPEVFEASFDRLDRCAASLINMVQGLDANVDVE